MSGEFQLWVAWVEQDGPVVICGPMRVTFAESGEPIAPMQYVEKFSFQDSEPAPNK